MGELAFLQLFAASALGILDSLFADEFRHRGEVGHHESSGGRILKRHFDKVQLGSVLFEVRDYCKRMDDFSREAIHAKDDEAFYRSRPDESAELIESRSLFFLSAVGIEKNMFPLHAVAERCGFLEVHFELRWQAVPLALISTGYANVDRRVVGDR